MDVLVPGRFALVVHDWGGAALVPAIARADRVARLVVMNSVPLLGGYRWHWVARLWRRRGVGEAVLAATTRPGLELLLRQRRGGTGPAHRELVDVVQRARGPHTDAAILRLYRSADEAQLAAAGRGLDRLTCPALVVWSDRDPYLPARFGPAYAGALPGARLRRVPGAGHWVWLDRPELVDEVVAFLDPLPMEG
jgi:pimeloyl-ACP methyl ester carboxylesterase